LGVRGLKAGGPTLWATPTPKKRVGLILLHAFIHAKGQFGFLIFIFFGFGISEM
jgi:hypothetical protein